jgi:tRNA (Thr-GGU) A37 N-methylase
MPLLAYVPAILLACCCCCCCSNGTPRQPLLVPTARARLELRQGLSPALLEGLEQYSHCWVLYVFHANTDLAKLLAAQAAAGSGPGAGAAGVKAKVTVPRLNGGRMGVLATRTPHRPVPIGLSVAQVGC